jgi:hypothetical protein
MGGFVIAACGLAFVASEEETDAKPQAATTAV